MWYYVIIFGRKSISKQVNTLIVLIISLPNGIINKSRRLKIKNEINNWENIQIL
jgi:hypothetical protein